MTTRTRPEKKAPAARNRSLACQQQLEPLEPRLLLHGSDIAGDQYVHQWIAQEAAYYYASLNKGAEVLSYLGGTDGIAHSGDDGGHGYLDNVTNAHWTGNDVLEGTYEEDTFGVWVRHFVAGGDGTEMNAGLSQQVDLLWDDWTQYGFPAGGVDPMDGRQVSALEAAQDCYDRAISLYTGGDKPSAYYWLGRTAHLVADMTVPAHVHNDRHLPVVDPDAYEDYVKTDHNFESWDRNSVTGTFPSVSSLDELLRQTADYTEEYPSGTTWGLFGQPAEDDECIANVGLHRPDLVDASDGFDASELRLMMDDLLPFALRQTTALYRLFYHAVDSTGPTVTITNLAQHDPNNPSTVSGPSISINAIADDDISGYGLNLFQLQYRQKAPGGSWTSWIGYGQHGTGTFTFSGQVGYEYGLRVTNEDGAGNLGTSQESYVLVTNTWYVDADAAGAHTGRSWAAAFTSPVQALNAAWPGDEIWVAAGTYKPTSGTDRSASFQLWDGVGMYGGFAGTETIRDQRNWGANPTVMSGDIGVVGDNSDNSTTVVYGWGNNVVLDGFVVTGGNANAGSSYFDNIGGGILWWGQMLTLRNMVFAGNSADSAGGAGYFGGPAQMVDCVLVGNHAETGAAVDSQSHLDLINCTIAGNSGTMAIVHSRTGGTTDVANCVIWGNTVEPGYVSNLYQCPGATLTLERSDVEHQGNAWGGLGNLDVDPAFVNFNNPAGPDGRYGTADDGLRLAQGSPVANMGGNALLPAGVVLDFAHETRVRSLVVDMGAYEATWDTLTLLGEVTFCRRDLQPLSDAGDLAVVPETLTISLWADETDQSPQHAWPGVKLETFTLSNPNRAASLPYVVTSTLQPATSYTLGVSVYGWDLTVVRFTTDSGGRAEAVNVPMVYEDVRKWASDRLLRGCKTGGQLTYAFMPELLAPAHQGERDAILGAMATLTDTGMVSFVETSSSNNPDVCFRMQRTAAQLGSDSPNGLASPPGVLGGTWWIDFATDGNMTPSNLLKESVLHAPLWQSAEGSDYPFEQVALHELGHVLGLEDMGYSSREWTVMDYSGSVTWLGWSDAIALRRLLGDNLTITAHCPVDLAVMDPSGKVVSATACNIYEAEHLRGDTDGDGDVEDVIRLPDRLAGLYTIQVTPRAGANPGDTFSLTVEQDGRTVELAHNVPVGGGPLAYGYALSSGGLNPSGAEQEVLEYINDMRLHPAEHLGLLVDSLSPVHSADPLIQSQLAGWHVSGPTLAAEWSQLSPADPLIWSEELCRSAAAHSQAMIDHDQQSHQVPGEASLGSRVLAEGYDYSTLGENIFAYCQSALQGHAGMAIDWGTPDTDGDGMQDPAGHRQNLMNPQFHEIGVSIIAESNPATAVGPYVLTQDLGARFDDVSPYLCGVIFNDADGDRFYDAGEGVGGATLRIIGNNGMITTLSMSAGGYQLPVEAGPYTIEFDRTGALPLFRTLSVGSANVKADAIVNAMPSDLQLLGGNVAENQPSGAAAGVLAGSDVGLGGAISCSLVSGAGSDDNGVFSIEGNALKTRESLDYESKNIYRIRVRATDGSGLYVEKALTVQVTDIADVQVVGRRMFYNGSCLDGNDPAANVGDDAAIATNRVALPGGQISTNNHCTGFSRGINGIMVDISGLTGSRTLGAADFVFRAGNSSDPSRWLAAPAPIDVSVRPGDGINGSDRFTIVWNDAVIKGEWLQVIVLSDANGGHAGLTANDVFYFASLPGDFNGDGAVDISDLGILAGNYNKPVTTVTMGDANGDGTVDLSDLGILAGNYNRSLPARPANPPAMSFASGLMSASVAATTVDTQTIELPNSPATENSVAEPELASPVARPMPMLPALVESAAIASSSAMAETASSLSPIADIDAIVESQTQPVGFIESARSDTAGNLGLDSILDELDPLPLSRLEVLA